MFEQPPSIDLELKGLSIPEVAGHIAPLLKGDTEILWDGCGTRKITDSDGRVWWVTLGHREHRQNLIGSGDRYSVRLASPPLTNGDAGLLDAMVSLLYDKGAYTDRTCRLHIYIGGGSEVESHLRYRSTLLFPIIDWCILTSLMAHAFRRLGIQFVRGLIS